MLFRSGLGSCPYSQQRPINLLSHITLTGKFPLVVCNHFASTGPKPAVKFFRVKRYFRHFFAFVTGRLKNDWLYAF
jgi:hypothetical protein